MATRINVIVTIDNLLKTIKPLLTKHEIDVYVNRLEKDKGLYNTKYDESQSLGNDPTYNALFFVSKKVEVDKVKSFYDDEICNFCLECKGGRYDDKEIEIIELRIVSKTPDKNIKAFSAAINSLLKKDDHFGMGILPLDNAIDKNTFYHKGDIKNRTIWRDFKRKAFYEPIQVAE